MDNSLKQRLLGAAVLIALAIIFVPMFLSGSGPKPVSETANLQAPPSPDRRFQERTLSLDLPPPGASPSATVPADGVVDSGQLATVDTATAPRLQPEPVVDVPAVAAPNVPVAAPAAAKPVPAPAAATVTEPAPEPANLPGTAANGNWFVHLGDYGASKNANDLVATLKKAGYSAYTEASRFGGKATLRVRVGPFADRAAAEATRLRIGQANVRAPATVVQNASDAKPAAATTVPAPTPVPTPAAAKPTAAAPVAATPARAGGFAVQLGAFKTVDEANKLRDQLRGASFPGFVDKVVREGQTLWRVRVGPEAERSGAEATRTRIRERLKLDGDVVGNP